MTHLTCFQFSNTFWHCHSYVQCDTQQKACYSHGHGDNWYFNRIKQLISSLVRKCSKHQYDCYDGSDLHHQTSTNILLFYCNAFSSVTVFWLDLTHRGSFGFQDVSLLFISRVTSHTLLIVKISVNVFLCLIFKDFAHCLYIKLQLKGKSCHTPQTADSGTHFKGQRRHLALLLCKMLCFYQIHFYLFWKFRSGIYYSSFVSLAYILLTNTFLNKKESAKCEESEQHLWNHWENCSYTQHSIHVPKIAMSLSGWLITLGNLHNLFAVTHSFQIISLLH